MKSNSYLIILIAFILAFSYTDIHAQTASDSAEEDKKTRQIEDLKERLATKVAEMRETKPGALIGKITSITLTTMSVETKTKEVKIELTDSIRVFKTVKGKRTAIEAEDLTKGETISVLGEYDTTLDVLKAAFIYVEEEADQIFFGIITQTDSEEYTLALKTDSAKTYTVDYEKSTRTFSWKDNTKTKSGFSKLGEGQTVMVAGNVLSDKPDRISAGRILSIGVQDGAKDNSNVATPSATPPPAS